MRVFHYFLFYSLTSLLFAALGAALPPDTGSGEPKVQVFSCILCYSLFSSIHTSRPPQCCPSWAPELAHPAMASVTRGAGVPSTAFYSILLFSVFYSIQCLPMLRTAACSSFRRRQGRCSWCGSSIAFQSLLCILVSPFIPTSPVSQIDSFRDPG